VDIKANPRIPTAGFSPREQLGDLVFAGTAELKRARFEGAVICVSDGILDPEFAKTPDLLPRMSGLRVLSRSQLELEMHLCLSQVTPEEAAAYVFAGADIVTLHLESFLMPNVGHSVDHEALLMCLEAVVGAGGRAGIAVYPTMSPNATLTRLGENGSLHLLSHLTVIMGDVALATPDRRWRYIPVMEDKIIDARALLADLGFEAEYQSSCVGQIQCTYYLTRGGRSSGHCNNRRSRRLQVCGRWVSRWCHELRRARSGRVERSEALRSTGSVHSRGSAQ